MLGYSEGELPADTTLWRSLMHADDHERATQVLGAALADGTNSYDVEFRLQHKDGHYLNLISRGFILRDEKGKAIRISGANMDITERKQMEQQVRHLAFYDALTQLPNRRLLSDRLSRAMAASKRSNCYGAVLFLDLDNFKPINDAHGHGVGDVLLIEAAKRLRTCIRDIDTVARFGGDEFVVTLSDLNTDEFEAAAQAAIVAEKILGTVSEPYRLSIRREGTQDDELIEHHCTVSIGVALFINHDSSEDELLKRADAAMYQAKVAGRNRIRFFDPAVRESAS
jgi:diguanylate cyclase (GGDEF)-like protein/PAS domain S-box-containing protein